MTKPFDPTKPVQTRDGRKARIICTDRNAAYPIVALIHDRTGHEIVIACNSEGRGTDLGQNPGDLVNIPKKMSGWINIIHNKNEPYVPGTIHLTEADAKKEASLCRFSDFTTIQITWEE